MFIIADEHILVLWSLVFIQNRRAPLTQGMQNKSVKGLDPSLAFGKSLCKRGGFDQLHVCLLHMGNHLKVERADSREST